MKHLVLFTKLFYVFFKVGLFTVGGGYAMLPILQKELVEIGGYTDEKDVLESYSLAQTLPGVIGSNAATLIGYKINGFWGALSCVLGVISPSIIIIVMIAMFFQRVEHLAWVESAFKGIRVIVLALLADSFVKLFKVAVFDKKTLIVALMSFVVVLSGFLNPIFMILVGAIAGYVIYKERIGA